MKGADFSGCKWRVVEERLMREARQEELLNDMYFV